MFTNAFWVTASVSDTKCLFGEAVDTRNYYIYNINYTYYNSKIIEIIHDEKNNSNNIK